jgi:transposase-like protein
MARKKPQGKVGENKSEIVAELPRACSDEDAAVEFMEKQRWGSSPCCPRCGSTNVYRMKDKDGSRNARYLWRCRDEKAQYTVKIGTVMEESLIPMRHWCYAFWAACASKKGVSALQIQRQTGLSYKSALFLMQRIRYAMQDDSLPPLKGDVEVDETYVGGKPRKAGPHSRKLMSSRTNVSRSGATLPDVHYSKRKTPVVALVERGGNVRARVMPEVTARNLKGAIQEMCDPSSRIMTDESMPYRGIGAHFAGGHHTVNHTLGEYARGDITTNTVEGFFSRLKRSIYGTHHNVSKKHLHRYVTQAEFLHNSRYDDDGQRFQKLVRQSDGKRLMYKEPSGGES